MPSELPPGPTGGVEQFELEDEEEYFGLHLAGCSLSDRQAALIQLLSSRLSRIHITGCLLIKPRIIDVLFDGCDLSNTECRESRINRVELNSCKLTGFKAVAADISNCHMQDCTAELAGFAQTRFKGTVFRNCKLKAADFRFCDLSGAAFINCDLQDAEFYEAKLVGADFRGSDITGMKLRAADLKGMVIDSEQAFLFARHFAGLLEITVLDI